MPWKWQGRDAEISSAGSPAEARTTQAWPNYEAEYLAKRLTDKVGKYDPQIENDVDRFVYLDKISKNYKEEADASLKAEFSLWLQGMHPDNINPSNYMNGPAKPKRVHMSDVNKFGLQRDDWKPTNWGQKQLTHLSGVRDYLRSEAESAARSEYYMNLLAEYGPQDLESAWMYFKHWVKGRPIGLDQNAIDMPTGDERKQSIRSPGFTMPPEDVPDEFTLAKSDFFRQTGERFADLTKLDKDYNDRWIREIQSNYPNSEARKDLYERVIREARLRYEQKNPPPREPSKRRPKGKEVVRQNDAGPSEEGSSRQPEPPADDALSFARNVEEEISKLLEIASLDDVQPEIAPDSTPERRLPEARPMLPNYRTATPHTEARFEIPPHRSVQTPGVRSVNEARENRIERDTSSPQTLANRFSPQGVMGAVQAAGSAAQARWNAVESSMKNKIRGRARTLPTQRV